MGLRLDVEAAEVAGHQGLARGIAEHPHERRIGVEDLTRGRRPVQADGHALEELLVARLGFAADSPPRGVVERGANGRDETGEVVGVLQDVVVEARLHGGDRELLAAPAGAQQHGKVGIEGAHSPEDVEGVDPARPVIRDHDVEVAARENGIELARLEKRRNPRRREAGAQGVDDPLAVPRALVDDENSQSLPAGLGPRAGTESSRGIG